MGGLASYKNSHGTLFLWIWSLTTRLNGSGGSSTTDSAQPETDSSEFGRGDGIWVSSSPQDVATATVSSSDSSLHSWGSSLHLQQILYNNVEFMGCPKPILKNAYKFSYKFGSRDMILFGQRSSCINDLNDKLILMF